MAWTDPYTGSVDWRFRAQELWDAIYQRWLAYWGDDPSSWGPPAREGLLIEGVGSRPLTGDPLNNSAYWNGIVAWPALGMQGLQRNVSMMVQSYADEGRDGWIDDSQTIEGAAEVVAWTINTIRAAAGLPLTKAWYRLDTVSDLIEYVPQRGRLWLRRAERIIDSAAATRDKYGNPAVAGQKARYLYYSHPFPGWPHNDQIYGPVYVCTASGDWYRDDTQAPDILSNADASPNALPSVGYTYPASDFGCVQRHDIVDYVICEELRKVVDLMRWTVKYYGYAGGYSPTYMQSDYSSARSRGLSRTGTGGSAGAIADLAANWSGASSSTGITNISAAQGRLYTHPSGNWSYDIFRTDGVYTIDNLTTSLARKVEFYSRADETLVQSMNQVFEDSGDEVTEGAYHLFDAQAASSSATATSARLGDISVAPTINLSNGYPSFGQTVYDFGYAIRQMGFFANRHAPIAVLKWNLGSGFYCSATA